MGDDPEEPSADKHREERHEPTNKPEEPPPKLTPAQMCVLAGLCEATKTDIAKLAEHYAVAGPENLPYERAFNALQKKLKKQEADAPKATEREPGDESEQPVPEP